MPTPLQKVSLATAAAAVLLAAPACEEVLTEADGDASPAIQTERTEYRLGEREFEWRGQTVRHLSVEIPYTYHNATGKTVYFMNCNGHVQVDLEKRVAGEWVLAWFAISAGCFAPPIEVAPGATYQDTLPVDHFTGGNIWPRFTVDEIEGTYRLVLSSDNTLHDFEMDAEGRVLHDGTPLPLATRISNEFVLREP